MFNFKTACLYIFLVVFTGGKTYSGIAGPGFNTINKEQKKELKEKLKKASDTAHAKYTRQRNKKPRGKQVIIPQISESAFAGFFTYKTFKSSYTESVNITLHYCVSLTRGPPMA